MKIPKKYIFFFWGGRGSGQGGGLVGGGGSGQGGGLVGGGGVRVDGTEN